MLVLQEDDCAPDAREYFNKNFADLMGLSVKEFKGCSYREAIDEGRGIRWTRGDFVLEFHCEDPYYNLYDNGRTAL